MKIQIEIKLFNRFNKQKLITSEFKKGLTALCEKHFKSQWENISYKEELI